MADLVQTAASVIKVGSASQSTKVAGEALTAGNTAYQNADGKWYAANNGGNTAQAGSTAIGVCVNSCPGANQAITVQSGGIINLGGTLVAGETYVLSTNKGRIAPVGDLVTGKYVTILGVAKDANNLAFLPNGPFASGNTRA